MKGKGKRVQFFLHSECLEGTEAVAVVEGVVEVFGDLDEVFRYWKVLLSMVVISITICSVLVSTLVIWSTLYRSCWGSC